MASNWLERDWPGVSKDAAAVAWGTIRCLTRAPEAKMTLLAPMVLFVLFVLFLGGRVLWSESRTFVPYLPSALLFLGVMGSAPFFTNAFGFDRSGFRALVLSAAPRRAILLGKNLATIPIFLLPVMTALIAVQILARPPMLFTLSALLQAVAMGLFLCLPGNLLSIMAPYQAKPGGSQPVKAKSGSGALLNMLFQFLFLLALIPASLPVLIETSSRWIPFVPDFPWNILLSALGLIAVGIAYRLSLRPLGDLLASREREILRVVTERIE